MTHRTLVNKAKQWLLGRHWSIAVTELSTSAGETPDAIGFKSSGGRSIVVECKVSREDYLCDWNKIFRQFQDLGMGNERYFFTPEGMLNIEELPEGWGLLEYFAVRGIVKVIKTSDSFEANKLNEVKFLVSIIRRLQLSTCVYVISEKENEE